jgi:RNA polymerase sigma-B factor
MTERQHGAYTSLSNEALLERLQQSGHERGTAGEIELREEIVRRNVGLVKSIAIKFLRSGEPLDDLIQAGYIGLLNAVANFDLARNTRFSTYASYLIQGEIRHYIRDKHSTIRIPQWVQMMNRRIKEAEEAFFQEEGRPPSLVELADSLALRQDQLTALLRGRESMTYVSIDQDRRSSDPSPAPPTTEHLLPESDGFPFDARMRILIAIEELTEIQRQVIQGLFYQGKSQAEIGKELGISQRQVSRMKDRILSDMRASLLNDSDN